MELGHLGLRRESEKTLVLGLVVGLELERLRESEKGLGGRLGAVPAERVCEGSVLV